MYLHNPRAYMSSELYPPTGSTNPKPPLDIPPNTGVDEPNAGEAIPWYLTAEYRRCDRAGLPGSASDLITGIDRIRSTDRSLYIQLGLQLSRTRAQLFELLIHGDDKFADRFLNVSDEEFDRIHYEMQQQEETLRRRVWNLIKQLRYMQRSALQSDGNQALAEGLSDGQVF